MSINTQFASSEQINAQTSISSKQRWNEKMQQFTENADKKTVFGGRRFLGLNKNNNEVWISYFIDRETLTLNIDTTHELNSIVQFAPKRVTIGMNEPSPRNMMEARQSDAGKVTHNTIRYLQKLIDLPATVGKVKGKCSRQLFMLVSNAVYEGGIELSKGNCRWRDIIDAWDLPSGRYFTIYG